ncbi:MAG: YggS family pyridoxal phosphate-dependent enzyme [Sediminibacterium sp.]|uniref:YggS family pyridoxal phosphate-dependent enzyme n=1 Tax=Sediminibacterium sp. TaxID=1917865 RepID=UPI0027159D74|nr:YggS family pyridoxal phosphate-dependent enzyme [Sediminibacterium sp.]MDO8995334.1 YggS family pyridoxal phosphate-dependent enzyme [Sediminibacterium sp.]MDP1973721.1 YggS family pyridoxal phosphate-dependent enzyme [Sediminibacterium sp.]
MPVNTIAYQHIVKELDNTKTCLVAVSKTKPNEDLLELYQLGQRDFGENYVQELVDKAAALPKDIRWHFIGHLQSNKVKYIAPFVHLIHGVDSLKLLQEINKQAIKHNREIDCLLQMHIAEEETKFGLDQTELEQIITQIDQFSNIRICGFMGMASFSDDSNKVRTEFNYLNSLFTQHKSWILEHSGKEPILSMGMSGDYPMAIEAGSTLVRIGSLLFGARSYAQ